MPTRPPLEELIGRWRAAEERLYPVVVVRSEVYERYLFLVRAIADELADAGSPDRLADAYERSEEIARAVVEREGVSVEGMDLGLVAGAAFSLRYREVVAEAYRREAQQRVREARERGDAWVVIHEIGSLEEGPFGPYSRLEMHLRNGMGIHMYAETDPASWRPRYGLEIVKLDPATGGRLGEGERRVFTEAATWRDEVANAKRRMSTSPP